MATTVDTGSRAGQLPKTAKFNVTADNDVIVSGEDALVVGAVFTGLATALNIDAGADITEMPFSLASDEELCVTTTGAGTVTISYHALPQATYVSNDI